MNEMSPLDPYLPPTTEVVSASGTTRFKVGTFWGLVLASPFLLCFLYTAVREAQFLINRNWSKVPKGALFLGVILGLILVVLGNSWCWACLFQIKRKRHFLTRALLLAAINSMLVTAVFLGLSRGWEEQGYIWMLGTGFLVIVGWIGGTPLSLGQGLWIHWRLRKLGLS